MGTKLSTRSDSKSVVVNVRGEKGQFFQGELAAHKQADSKYTNEDGSKKKLEIYEFKVEDTNMQLQKQEGKEYVEATVAPGDIVSLFAPTRLNNALRQASVGQHIKFTYLGLGKATGRGGKPHEYDVEAI
jgi:hypothetical protein